MIDFIMFEPAGVLTIAEHGYPVSQISHFAQPMRNVDDRHALIAKLADHLEKLLGLVLREARGGLVHNHNFCLGRNRLGNLDHLLPPDGQISDQRRRRDLKRDHVKILLSLLVNARELEEAPLLRFSSQKDIRTHIKIVRQIQFLVDHRDPQSQSGVGRIDGDPLAFEKNLPRGRLLDARQNFHQRAFARTIFADQRMHFARTNREIRPRARPAHPSSVW